MITLITGAPGAGKTAALVSMLADLGKDRAIYVNGIPDLKIPHIVLDDPHTWPDTVPDGSVVIIDEVQTTWRPSGPGQKIPESIQKLETHRHRGLDFYIITQGPNLVHSNVRALVGRHVHLRDIGFFGRWWYEWPETADNCRTGWKTAPIKKRYKLPKQIFGQYKSATIHVKPERSFPKIALVFGAALIGVAIAGYQTYRMISTKIDPQKTAEIATTQNLPFQNPKPKPNPNAGYDPLTQTMPAPQSGPVDELTGYIPRIPTRPETAPAYDHLRQVVNMPQVSGAICNTKKCVCVTQQGTDAGLTDDQCREWLDKPPFDPYRAKPRGDLVGNGAAGNVLIPAQNGAFPSSTSAPTMQTAPGPSGLTSNPRLEAKEEARFPTPPTQIRAAPGVLPLRLEPMPTS